MHPSLSTAADGAPAAGARAAPAMLALGPDPVATTARALGARIRALRQQRRLTEKHVADRCGVTPSLISQVERGITNPSLDSLYQISAALGVPMEALFREDLPAVASAPHSPGAPPARRPDPVVRHDERRRLDLPGGIRWERLAPDQGSAHEFLEIVMEVGATTGPAPLRHRGHEYALVLEGVACFELDAQHYVLRPGDSISFDSSIPHRTHNVGDVPLRAVHFMLDSNP